MSVNNPVSIFLINRNIILYHAPFIYLWISKTSLVSIVLKPREKNFAIRFNPAIFILLIVKSFEILPKHSTLD